MALPSIRPCRYFLLSSPQRLPDPGNAIPQQTPPPAPGEPGNARGDRHSWRRPQRRPGCSSVFIPVPGAWGSGNQCRSPTPRRCTMGASPSPYPARAGRRPDERDGHPFDSGGEDGNVRHPGSRIPASVPTAPSSIGWFPSTSTGPGATPAVPALPAGESLEARRMAHGTPIPPGACTQTAEAWASPRRIRGSTSAAPR